MEKLQQIIEECMEGQLIQIIISNKRHAGVGKKVVVRPFAEKGNILFQMTNYDNNQVFHKNSNRDEAIVHIIELLKKDYKQIEIFTENRQVTALVSKKGKASIKQREVDGVKKVDLLHNRKKQYVLSGEEVIPFLVELGVQTKEGKIVDKKYKKFRQINRFLEFVRDVLPELPTDRQITILDFGCGKSYLTFAMYYYLKIVKGYAVRMIGLD